MKAQAVGKLYTYTSTPAFEELDLKTFRYLPKVQIFQFKCETSQKSVLFSYPMVSMVLGGFFCNEDTLFLQSAKYTIHLLLKHKILKIL